MSTALRWIVRGLLLLLVGACLVAASGLFYPSARSTVEIDEFCCVCGAERTRTMTRWFGVLVDERLKSGDPTVYTEAYEKLIGEPHNHRWRGVFGTRASGTWLRNHECGGGNPVGPGPDADAKTLLTTWGLAVVGQLQREPRDFRRALYSRILGIKSREKFEEFSELYQRTKRMTAAESSEIWHGWLEAGEEAGDDGVGASAGSLEGWRPAPPEIGPPSEIADW